MNRYKYTSTDTRWDGKQVYKSLLLAPIPFASDDIYIITNETMYLDALAYTYYKDPSLWWIIAQANNIGKGRLSVESGLQLRIPRNPSNVLNNIKAVNK
jgi:hypothetical protein